MKKNRNWATWKRLVIRLQKNSYSDRHYGRSWLTRTWRNFRWHRTRRRYIPIVHHCHVHQDSSSHVNTGHIWLQKWLLKLTKFHTSNWKYQVKFRWVFINVFVLHFVKKFVQKIMGSASFNFELSSLFIVTDYYLGLHHTCTVVCTSIDLHTSTI